jgi:iron complex outermembrane receptor protein
MAEARRAVLPRSTAATIVLALAVLTSPEGAAAAESEAGGGLPEVLVTTTPLPGTGVDPDKLPGNVQTLLAEDLDANRRSQLLPLATARRLASVSVNNEQGSPYQPDFVYRGFAASPVAGVAQGLAVYQDGVRLNEAFGDAVNWDLVPQFAVQRMTVQSNNPVFGLNALGGAVTLEMKNGFNYAGAALQLSGGSYGNLTGYGEYGAHQGAFGLYAALGGVRDGGFRYLSPTDLRQAYADFGYEEGALQLHLSGAAANNYLGATGPTPVELLAVNPRAAFTSPQEQRNQMQLLQLAGSFKLAPGSILSFNAYHRHYQQHLVDGNTTAAQTCANEAAWLCLGGASQYPQDVLFSDAGTPVPSSVLPAAATPGEIDRTGTDTDSDGAAAQYALAGKLAGHENSLAVGLTIDDSTTAYSAAGELGELLPTLAVLGAGLIIDQGRSPSAAPPIEAPVSVHSGTRYFGAYLSDTLTLSAPLAITVSGRFNEAHIDLTDQLGTELDGSHSYSRFNPGAGLTYKLAAGMTVYAGYSEANRAPTAGELSCADPASPCLLGSFLVADPPLKQVVAHSAEAGVRGSAILARDGGSVHWSLGMFRTDNRDDILLLAIPVNGFGYFANVGTTRRQGLEAAIRYRDARWEAELSGTYLEATFREGLTTSSNSPAADGQGNIHVQPGDQIPLNPRYRITTSLEYRPTARWRFGADARYTSSQYLAGDESNQEPPLPAYMVVDLHAAWRAAQALELFVSVDNVFDRTYYNYGTFTRLDGLPPNYNLTDARSYSPSPPRSFFGGLRWTLP